jgi:hypothetical protein
VNRTGEVGKLFDRSCKRLLAKARERGDRNVREIVVRSMSAFDRFGAAIRDKDAKAAVSAARDLRVCLVRMSRLAEDA